MTCFVNRKQPKEPAQSLVRRNNPNEPGPGLVDRKHSKGLVASLFAADTLLRECFALDIGVAAASSWAAQTIQSRRNP